MKQTREQRGAADRAEYEASLRRAEEAHKDQQARASLPPVPSVGQAGDLGLMFGLPGLAIGTALDIRNAQKRAIDAQPVPPRPD